jgi:mono/diheme cytochrome c family protein
MLGAIFSCISGYFLSLSGDYYAETVSRHQWMGIYTAIASLVLYLLYRIRLGEAFMRVIGLVVLALVSITGHLGGTLTHGEGYLTEVWSKGNAEGPIWPAMPDVKEAVVYSDLVQPLLQARCYSCHGSTKQKGKLRLDQPEFILKGGEEGKVIEMGRADESAMIERLLLPLQDDDHMPPKEKPQLTQSEVQLLRWWIQQGADFNKKVAELEQDEKIQTVLMSIQAGVPTSNSSAQSDMPTEPVAPADAELLAKLREAGVMILPVAANSNYLQASFFTARANMDSLLGTLAMLKDQLVWLKLDGANISDAAMKHVGALTNLRKLHLSNTPITDAGIAQLAGLQELRSLNLFATGITAEGLKSLASLTKLKNIYLYKTSVSGSEYESLRALLPSVRIDTGGYVVPTFETDTTELKY